MSDQSLLPNPQLYFEPLSDPHRETKNKLPALQDIIVITLCGMLSGVEDSVGIAQLNWNN